MHQTRKGNQWYFGMKAHIGVDSEMGILHSMSATATNAHDVSQAHNLLRGGESVVWVDVGYPGAGEELGAAGGAVRVGYLLTAEGRLGA